MGDVFPHGTPSESYNDMIDPKLDSFRYPQDNIEQWNYDESVAETTVTKAVIQEDLVCYGTVSRLLRILYLYPLIYEPSHFLKRLMH